MSETTTTRPAKAAGELSGMLLPELKKVAGQLGIEGATKLSKADLIQSIADLQAANREAAKAEALTRVLAWQLSQEMERKGITKAALAESMHTSRAQVDRILKAKGNVTIESLQRAAALVGRELRLELI